MISHGPIVTDSRSLIPKCPCEAEQTIQHIIYDCSKLQLQRDKLKTALRQNDGSWPRSEKELVYKYGKFFAQFVTAIDFDAL